MKIRSLFLAALTLLSAQVYADDQVLRLGSWNVKRLGQGQGTDFPAMASVAGKFDILALQEVMTESALSKLETALEQQSGESWSVINSHAVGRGSYTEHYAFAWKDRRVAYEDGAVVLIDRADIFSREPFSAHFKFKPTGYDFVFATVHILYGKSESQRLPEIKALADYWVFLQDSYQGVPAIYLAGDFNLPPSHPAFAPLKTYAKPLITKGASTLSGKDGFFVNLYDNIFVPVANVPAVQSAGVFPYPKALGISHEKARAHVSDHAPVFALVGNPSGSSSASTAVTSPAKSGQVLINRPSDIRGELAKPAASTSGVIVGNRNSKIYHLPNCASYSQVSQRNAVQFKSSAEAESAGYRRARNCS